MRVRRPECGTPQRALDAVVARWSAESSWAQRVTIAHALIGWTKGTGLMGHNDAIVDAARQVGIRLLLEGEEVAKDEISLEKDGEIQHGMVFLPPARLARPE